MEDTTVKRLGQLTWILRATDLYRRIRVWFRGAPVLSVLVLILAVVLAAFGPWVSRHDPLEINLAHTFGPPVWAKGGTLDHILGTDHLGRDVLSRVIQGARISMMVGILAVAVAGTTGTFLGLLAGYLGGWYDRVIMRVTESMLSLPFLMIAIAIVAVLGPSLTNVILVIGLLRWPDYARVVRSECLKVREYHFVRLAIVAGASRYRILTRHMAPNVMNNAIVVATLQVGTAIIAEASLSFLGLGIPRPIASWGGMLADAQKYLSQSWWLAIFPGAMITLVVLAVNLLGDWLSVRLDPTLRQL